MIRSCSTPGCVTLTFGEVCLGCLQRQAKEERAERPSADDAARPEHATASG